MLVCPDLEQLQRLLDGSLSPEEQTRLESHADDCRSCRARLEELSGQLALVDEMKALVPERRQRALGPGGAPRMLGGFRVLRELARGGMGVVYLAEQDHPHRLVAIKVVHPGILSERSLRRFEFEVEVLGKLDHPGIARILAAGTAEPEVADEPGAPYFVMDYVEGLRLDQHITRCDPDVVERLELFLELCDAVQHAHTKGVIHRDLKPGNVLVDAAGHPRVIDFGLARAADPRLVTESVGTRAGHVLGTLPYMPPEQLGGDPESMDVRSDVYGLGALLYELLCGRPPLDLSATSLAEAARRIAHEEPPLPTRLNPTLDRELDWILLKALEKDSARRYQSVAELAADVRAYRDKRPLQAGPRSRTYALGLFVRRYRLAVSLAAVALLALLAGLGGTTWGLFRASQAEQDALASAAAEREAKDVAREKEALARDYEHAYERGTDLLSNVLEPLASSTWGGPETLRAFLDQGVERLEELDGQPEVKAKFLDQFAQIYFMIDEQERAAPLLAEVLEIRREVLGDTHLETFTALQGLALLRHHQGARDEAEALFRAALGGLRDLVGPDHDDTLSCASNLAWLLKDQERHEEALALFEDVYTRNLARHGPLARPTLLAGHALAQTLALAGEIEQGLEQFARTIPDMRATFGDQHPRVLFARDDRGVIYLRIRRLVQAEAELREVHRGRRAVLGEGHPETLGTLSNLVDTLRLQGRVDEALVLAVEGHAAGLAELGPRHGAVQQIEGDVAILEETIGVRRDHPVVALRLALMESDRALGADHPDSMALVARLVDAYQEAGLYHAGSLPLIDRLLQHRLATVGADHVDTLRAHLALARYCRHNAREQAAEALLTRVAESIDDAARPAPAPVLAARYELAELVGQDGRHERARALLASLLPRQELELGPGHAETLRTRTLLAQTLARLGDEPRALEHARAALRSTGRSDPAHPARRALVEALEGDGAGPTQGG